MFLCMFMLLCLLMFVYVFSFCVCVLLCSFDFKGRNINFYKLENFGWWMSRPTATRVTFDLPERKEHQKAQKKQKIKKFKKKTKKRKKKHKNTLQKLSKNVKNLMKGKGHKRLPRVLHPSLETAQFFMKCNKKSCSNWGQQKSFFELPSKEKEKENEKNFTQNLKGRTPPFWRLTFVLVCVGILSYGWTCVWRCVCMSVCGCLLFCFCVCIVFVSVYVCVHV